MYAYYPKPALQMVVSSFAEFAAKGAFDITSEDTLNKKFPHIKPSSVKDILEAGWKGK